jgi:hypothetical protein
MEKLHWLITLPSSSPLTIVMSTIWDRALLDNAQYAGYIVDH